MRIVFMGTPDFAVPCLEKLIDNGHEIAGVFTQPDKPVGRKQVMTPPPVKSVAINHGIQVYQPETLKDGGIHSLLSYLHPDVIIVVAYGKILPEKLLSIAPFGCINVHASLLPKYRGSAPIQWAVLNGDKMTGVTVMQMDKGIDTGDMLLVRETEIDVNETSAQLFERLSELGANALINVLNDIKNVQPKPQPKGDFGYANMITKKMSPIDWKRTAFEVHNQIRGLQTWPCASTTLTGKTLKIHKSVLSDFKGNVAGEVVDNTNRLVVSCGDGNCVELLELQLDGKKRMDTKTFLFGNNIKIGTILGG